MQASVLVSLALVAAWLIYTRWSDSRRRQLHKLPPGPPCLPIIGNMLQLGPNPHKSFANLSKTYGPLMFLKLGNQSVVVASSPETAKEVLQRHGHVFSTPFTPKQVCVHGHGDVSMAMQPAASDIWKKIRRIYREKLVSNQALQATQDIRRERLRKLNEYINMCSGEGLPMNVGESAFTTILNLIFSTLFSIEIIQFGVIHNEFEEHVKAFSRYMGVPNVADFFPVFAPLDPQGLRRNVTPRNLKP